MEERNAARAAQLAQQGQYNRALQALDSAGMAEITHSTKKEMKRKHSSADSPSDFSRTNTSTPQLQFTAKDVQKAALSFRKGSAPGPSGLRPEHLSVVLKGAPANRTDKAGAALTRLVNLMVRGEVPEEVASFLFGA